MSEGSTWAVTPGRIRARDGTFVRSVYSRSAQGIIRANVGVRSNNNLDSRRNKASLSARRSWRRTASWNRRSRDAECQYEWRHRTRVAQIPVVPLRATPIRFLHRPDQWPKVTVPETVAVDAKLCKFRSRSTMRVPEASANRPVPPVIVWVSVMVAVGKAMTAAPVTSVSS